MHHVFTFIAAGMAAGCLISNLQAAPSIQAISPAPGATVSSLTQVTVTFNTAVTGVELEDFLINGSPPSSVSGVGAARTFTFTQPPAGTVQFAWDGSHFITDLAGSRFDETAVSAIWSCTLLDTISPVVRLTTPAPGAVVRSLTGIEVTLSEPVSGVDAGDLLIGGQAATAVVGTLSAT